MVSGFVVMIGMLLTGLCGAATAALIDEGAATPRDERQVHAAWVNWRPASGQKCTLNPPRFSWPYHPAIVGGGEDHTFTLQISPRADMSKLTVEVKEIPYNFYNALPVLEGRYHWFWRVGWDVGTEGERWGEVREFTIQPGAEEWDRSALGDVGALLQGHPRIGFTPENIEQVRAVRDQGGHSERLYGACLARADKYMGEEWFGAMPDEDPIVPMDQQYEKGRYTCTHFRNMGRKLQIIAMAYMLSGDEKYLALREPLLKLASYPPGGESSPEGLGSKRKWATLVTMYMGLCYDWLYDTLSEDERATVAHSLDWRIAHILNEFSWRRGGKVFNRGISGMAGSHQYENVMWTLPGALACYETSEAAREFVEIALHYLVGVTNGFGPEEAWNEGVLYGNAKSASMLHATVYTALTIPELAIERNPYLDRIGSFFAYLTPLGIERSAWGNYGIGAGSHLGGHQRNFRRLALLTGDGTFMQNWLSCNEIKGGTSTELQEYLLAARFEDPEPVMEAENRALFNIGGWAMAFSGPPSDPATYRDGVGIVFHSRPRGGYSHSFNSENAFELFAYGSVIATGGGRKTNGDRHAAHTMSHNAILVDGLGQDFDQHDPETAMAGRIIAWHAEPGLVYWCGDATVAYQTQVPYLTRALRHVLLVDDSYFVIFDDLATAEDHDPARLSWLYHIHQDVPVELNEDEAAFSYEVGEASVQVRHLIGAGELEMVNLRGEDGYKNPITGEDMLATARDSVERSPLRKFTGEPVWNNIWASTKPTREAQFLAVILPWRPDQRAPSIESLGERSLAITTPQGRRTICFGPPGERESDITVDYERVRGLGGEATPPEGWEQTWQADLSNTEGWKLDGEGSVEHLADGVLKINTETPTVYWADETFEAPLLIDFEARTKDAKCRAILFFMAEGMGGEDIFGWERTGDYGDYAYTEKMRLYTVGMLREGCGTETNFRFLGGILPEHLQILKTPRDELPDEQKQAYAQAVQDFQPATIPSTACDGYELGEWMRYQVLVDGHLVRVWGNGRLLHEVTDPEPLGRGRIGFRNFGRGTGLEVRKLSVNRQGE